MADDCQYSVEKDLELIAKSILNSENVNYPKSSFYALN